MKVDIKDYLYDCFYVSKIRQWVEESFKAINFLVLFAKHGLLLLLGLEAHQVHLPHFLLEIPMLRLVLHLEGFSISLSNSKIFPLDKGSLFCDFRVEGWMHSVGSISIDSDFEGIVLLLLIIKCVVGDDSFDPIL